MTLYAGCRSRGKFVVVQRLLFSKNHENKRNIVNFFTFLKKHEKEVAVFLSNSAILTFLPVINKMQYDTFFLFIESDVGGRRVRVTIFLKLLCESDS